MKAVMLAGGEGTRLRPISCHSPKPMVPLFGKPVMEHAVCLLARAGIDQIAVTLQTLPYVIMDYFGDGSPWGVSLQYAVEEKPLGTAGGVRALSDFCAGQDFFVVSGDAVFDYDLQKAMAFHKENDADATLLLARPASSLLEYGLVMCNEQQEIVRFIEKPSWGQVFADTANTGLYILHPRVLADIPDNTFFDFAKDLFPLLLNKNARLMGYLPEGYWCDMGDAEALRRVHFDALAGKVGLSLPAPCRSPGLWTASPVPSGVHLSAPCYIGAGVTLEPGARLGPYAVIGDGSRVGADAVIENSVLESARIGARSSVTGAYLGKNTVLSEGVHVAENAVLADGVFVEAHARFAAGARVWPDKEIEAGAHVTGSLTAGQERHGARFGGGGKLSGLPHVDLTPEFCLRLGAAAALAANAGIGLAHTGGQAARMAACALEAGVCAAGQMVTRHDASFAACAGFSAALYRLPLSIFISQQDERLTLHWFGADGCPLSRAQERRVEAIAARGELTFQDARGVGGVRTLSGVPGLYGLSAATPPSWASPYAGLETLTAAVRTEQAAGEALYTAMATAGVCVHNASPGQKGWPLFSVTEDGYEAAAQDEQGAALSHAQMLACLISLEGRAGTERLAVPYAAPAFLDELAAQQGIGLLRGGRDGQEAASMLAAQPFTRDGIFLCLRVAYGLAHFQMTLSELVDSLPPFYTHATELALTGDRGAVMRVLTEAFGSSSPELVEGLRARVAGGWVHVSPLPSRRALRIAAEGESAEIAAELCDLFVRRARNADDSVASPKI